MPPAQIQTCAFNASGSYLESNDLPYSLLLALFAIPSAKFVHSVWLLRGTPPSSSWLQPFAPFRPLEKAQFPSLPPLFQNFTTTMAVSDFPQSCTCSFRSQTFKAPLGLAANDYGISRVPMISISACCGAMTAGRLPEARLCRSIPCCLPYHPTRSALPMIISQLDTVPTLSPVNA